MKKLKTFEEMWAELEKDKENGRLYKMIRRAAEAEARVDSIKYEVLKELADNIGQYCEIRKCNSPYSQHDYIWFNTVKFNEFLEKLYNERRK